jgi:hypothetical protein
VNERRASTKKKCCSQGKNWVTQRVKRSTVDTVKASEHKEAMLQPRKEWVTQKVKRSTVGIRGHVSMREECCSQRGTGV